MEERYLRGYNRDPVNQQAFPERTASIMIAIPFVVCFSMFGIINLVGGTILTIMSCKAKAPNSKSMIALQKLAKSSTAKLMSSIDPMQVVGIMLLLTGSFLVIIGLALGIIACRSVHQQRRRQERRGPSGQNTYSLAERSGRRTSSFCSTSFTSIRSKGNEKRALEKTVSPIMEVNSENDSTECEKFTIEMKGIKTPNHVKKVSPSSSVETVKISPGNGISPEDKKKQQSSSSQVAITMDPPQQSAVVPAEVDPIS